MASAGVPAVTDTAGTTDVKLSADDDDVDSEAGDSLITFDYAALEEAQRIAEKLGEAKEDDEADGEQGKRKQRGGCKESHKRRKRQRREDDIIRAKQAGLPVPSLKELLAAAAANPSSSSSSAPASSTAAAAPADTATAGSTAQAAPAAAASSSASSAVTGDAPSASPSVAATSSAPTASPDAAAAGASSAAAEAAARRLSKEAARRSKVAEALNARTVFVTNLPFKVTEKEVTDWLSICGKVKGVRFGKDKATSKSLGYAHVQFESAESVPIALEKCDRFDVQGRVVRVARVGKGEKCQFELPEELREDIRALIREAYEGKNISTIKDAWQKRHPGQKLDTSKYGFKNFSMAMRTIEGLSLEHHCGNKLKLTFLAFFTGSETHKAFVEERIRQDALPKFCVGDAVEVRDRGHCVEFKPAKVTSVEPLMVKVNGWSWSTTWDEVRLQAPPENLAKTTSGKGASGKKRPLEKDDNARNCAPRLDKEAKVEAQPPADAVMA